MRDPWRCTHRARALVDAVYDWSRFNSLPRGYAWIRRELENKRVTPAELVDATLGRNARARGTGCAPVAQAREEAAALVRPDPMDTHAAKARATGSVPGRIAW